ncbi:hypothetical protein [Mycobacterium canetti]|nr:hypothetical protein [Mycobacterium canetti]
MGGRARKSQQWLLDERGELSEYVDVYQDGERRRHWEGAARRSQL